MHKLGVKKKLSKYYLITNGGSIIENLFSIAAMENLTICKSRAEKNE
jgi:hypothetical protein